jgi:[NiFe] hydrogenase assembly HybE family chaperone
MNNKNVANQTFQVFKTWKVSTLLMIWKNSEQISDTLEATFNEILAKRMRGLPIVNAALSVQAVGFNRFGEDWLGILITPWFMNLLLLPGADNTWRNRQSGTKIDKHFPYGTFEFTLASEAQLGTYALCSLFSPMFQFEDQAAALATAQAVLQGLSAEVEPRGVSRRELLRGVIGKR